ncbi:MAG: hypothetical protein EAY75_11900 [Bacteroidetes bacterium]|nr:MAG: hypothetical protein EAY75_11900 [Bacteroidota bacterium]
MRRLHEKSRPNVNLIENKGQPTYLADCFTVLACTGSSTNRFFNANSLVAAPSFYTATCGLAASHLHVKKSGCPGGQLLFWFVLNCFVPKQVITCDCIISQLVDELEIVLNKIDNSNLQKLGCVSTSKSRMAGAHQQNWWQTLVKFCVWRRKSQETNAAKAGKLY